MINREKRIVLEAADFETLIHDGKLMFALAREHDALILDKSP